MGLGEFFRKLFGIKFQKQIADQMDVVEPSDGDKNDLTSIAYYKACLRNNRDEINRITKYVEKYTKVFEGVKKEFPEGTKEYESAKEEMYRWIVALDRHKSETEFFRPNSQTDIEYREQLIKEFPDKLKRVLSPNFDLRFHSTSIGFAKQILQSKAISSTPDRYDGYIKNSDGIGEISVSNRDDIRRTITHYAGLKEYLSALPAGCVFALLPKDESDATNYNRSVIASIDFRKNPEQLFGIFTTPENVEKVKEWMKTADFNPELVYTYEEFLNVVKTRSAIGESNRPLKERIAIPQSGKGIPSIGYAINTGEVKEKSAADLAQKNCDGNR